jgi:hypothetical protein
MNLQNGYKVIYEKTADGKRTFYATKNVVCDPTVDDKIIEEATIGEYKLIYEKNGEFYGSTSGIPSDKDDVCLTTENFKKVFVKGYTGEEATTYGGRRTRRAAPVVEEPIVEEPVVEMPAEEVINEIEE